MQKWAGGEQKLSRRHWIAHTDGGTVATRAKRLDNVVTEKDAASKVLETRVQEWCTNETNARRQYGEINDWDVSQASSFRGLFSSCTTGNPNISKWKTGHVKDMSIMFKDAHYFNSDLSQWDVGKVEDMSFMFIDAYRFESNLGLWDVANVHDMIGMFQYTERFNSELSSWNLQNVEDISNMFNGALAFNSDLTHWNVGRVNAMQFTFNGASTFNADVSRWNMSNVKDTRNMFNGAKVFNNDLSRWDIGGVHDMFGMFFSATLFNSDLSQWDVGNVKSMNRMFFNAALFNSDLSQWNVGKVEDMASMFTYAISFNSDISRWNVSKVQNMQEMFSEARSLNSDLGPWAFSPTQDLTTMQNVESNCTFERPGNYAVGTTYRLNPFGRFYCNNGKNQDGAICTVMDQSQCDTGTCRSKRCCGYSRIMLGKVVTEVTSNCDACTSNGACFVPPRISRTWNQARLALPSAMDGHGKETKSFAWNNKNTPFNSSDIIVWPDAPSYTTSLTYQLRWLQQQPYIDNITTATMKVGDTVPLDFQDWDPNEGPGGVIVNCLNGKIQASPQKIGTYSAWLIAVDDNGRAKSQGMSSEFDQMLIKKWVLEVIDPVPFSINLEYVHVDADARPDIPRDAFRDTPGGGTLYIVGETYRFAPLKIDEDGINGNRSATNGDADVTFTLVGAPKGKGLLIDPTDGFILGVPTSTGNFTAMVYAIDGSGARSNSSLRNITFDVRNGPNRRGCGNNGTAVAVGATKVRCDCTGIDFKGENCEVSLAAEKKTTIIVSVLAALIIFLSIAYMYRARYLRLKAQDDALARARKAYGLVSLDTTRQGMRVNSGDLVGVTTNPSFVGLDVAHDSDVAHLLEPAAGYINDLLAYEDDHEGDADANRGISAGVHDSPPQTAKRKRRRSGLSKFVAPTMSLGKSTLAAKGLDVLLGVDPKTYMHVKQKVKVILKEFAKNGTDEDNKNLKTLIEGTYKHPPNSDGSPLTAMDIRGQSMTIGELMASSNVQDAGLEIHHVLALRLYTTSTYMSINNPMRQSPPVLPHPFAATMYYISDALSKLRELQGKNLAMRNETLVFWRGMKDLQITDEFIRTGGSEMACMSTTSDQKVAEEFALSKSPLLFKFVSKSFMSHGADISFLSVYPGEAEVLYPPLTYLRPIKISEKTIGTTVYKVVEVEPVFPK